MEERERGGGDGGEKQMQLLRTYISKKEECTNEMCRKYPHI